MKKILLSATILLGMLGAVGCTNLEEMNINPNNPTSTHPKLLLTTISNQTFRHGNDGMYAARKVIQADGESADQYYKWTRGDFGYYTRLRNVEKMAEEADRAGAPSYKALALFFKAYHYYELTLRFGDIPCTEALRGEKDAIYAPVYDSQEKVFETILAYLSEAENILAADGSNLDGDIIYGGKSAKWRKLINSFHLKVLMTLSHHAKVGSTDVRSEFARVASLPIMESIADNGQLTYIDQQDCRYPQFNAQWSGYYMDDTFIQRMRERRDPRLFLFAGQTNQGKTQGKAIDDFSSYEGGDPAAPYSDAIVKVGEGRISPINSRYRTSPVGEPTILMGYAELQQILAEAAVRGWIAIDAKAAYERGIRASFEFYRTYAPTYANYLTDDILDAYIAGPMVDLAQATTTEAKIERIVMQKFLAAFYQGRWDPFFDHLRTGYPDFKRPAGVNVPKRWMYPQSEYDNNMANVVEAVKRQYGQDNDNIHATPWWIK